MYCFHELYQRVLAQYHRPKPLIGRLKGVDGRECGCLGGRRYGSIQHLLLEND